MPQQTSDGSDLKSEIRMLRRKGELNKALVLLDSAKKADRPKGFRFERASLLYGLTRNSESLAELDRMTGPGARLRTTYLRARVLIAMDQLDEAASLLRDTGANRSNQGPAILLQLARKYIGQGDFDRAAQLAQDARVVGADISGVQKWELSAYLLTGSKDALLTALKSLGPKTSEALAESVRHAFGLLKRNEVGDTDRDIRQKHIADAATGALYLVDDPEHAETLRRELRGLLSDEADEQLWSRWGEILRAQAPVFYKDVGTDDGDVNSPITKALERCGRWLGIDESDLPDWIDQAARGIQFRKRLNALVLHSKAHCDALAADMEPLDWSEVRSCQSNGRPVILVSLHSTFIPAAMIEVNRLDLGVKAISGNWLFKWHPEFSKIFLHDKVGQVFAGRDRQFTSAALTRALLEKLQDGGIAFVMADGNNNARPRDLQDQNVRVNLPAPLWKVAQRTGAAVFYMESIWRDGAMASRLERWDLPEDTESDEATEKWYDLVLGAARSSYLADPRNVLPTKWLLNTTQDG